MKKILALSAFAALIGGCKKSSEESTLTISKDNIAGTYKVTGETITAASMSTDTYTTSYDVCERDDTYAFTAAGGFTYTDAGTKCSPSNPTVTSTYTLSGSQIAVSGMSNVSGTIETLTATTMKITTSSSSGGITVKQTTILTKQ